MLSHLAMASPLSWVVSWLHCCFGKQCLQWRWRHRARGTRAPPPLLQMAGHRGHHEYINSKQETDQTVLTIMKALTKTTNCTFRAKKVDGTTKKFCPALIAGSVPPILHRITAPTFKFFPAPLST